MKLSVDDLFKHSLVLTIDSCICSYFFHMLRCVGVKTMPEVFNGFKVKDNNVLNCTYGHLAMFRLAQARNWPYVCIFEDDAIPTFSNMSDLQEVLDDIPDDAVGIQLGYNKHTSQFMQVICAENGQVSEFFTTYSWYGSHAYIVFRDSFEEYINMLENSAIADIPFQKSDKFYTAIKPLFHQYSVFNKDHCISKIISGERKILDDNTSNNTYSFPVECRLKLDSDILSRFSDTTLLKNAISSLYDVLPQKNIVFKNKYSGIGNTLYCLLQAFIKGVKYYAEDDIQMQVCNIFKNASRFASVNSNRNEVVCWNDSFKSFNYNFTEHQLNSFIKQFIVDVVVDHIAQNTAYDFRNDIAIDMSEISKFKFNAQMLDYVCNAVKLLNDKSECNKLIVFSTNNEISIKLKEHLKTYSGTVVIDDSKNNIDRFIMLSGFRRKILNKSSLSMWTAYISNVIYEKSFDQIVCPEKKSKLIMAYSYNYRWLHAS